MRHPQQWRMLDLPGITRPCFLGVCLEDTGQIQDDDQHDRNTQPPRDKTFHGTCSSISYIESKTSDPSQSSPGVLFSGGAAPGARMILAATARLAEQALRLRAALGGSASLRERLVIGPVPAPARIWVHGASVGELNSARDIITTLAKDSSILVTCNTMTGRETVRNWGLPCRLAPLDLPGALERFLTAAQPQLMITLEAELWPLRSRKLAERQVAQAIIGARMSQRSAASWARLRWVIRPMLERLAALSAQDQDSESRLRHLGLPDAAILPRLDLKLLTPARVVPVADSPARNATVLAASTHDGEETLILDAWQKICETHPALRLILAIRHPDRGDEVARLIRDRGLTCARRSAGQEDGRILLADTIGEMGRWYDAAALCVIGGTFTDKGGHTPWEPAAHRCAILHGPHVSNFTDSFADLEKQHAALPVTSETLVAEMTGLLAEPARMHRMGDNARRVLLDRAGDPAELLSQLQSLAHS
jgi:3-deoxy-D-manno-octulosonic-acid transferase